MNNALIKSITVAGLAAVSLLALSSCNTAEVTNVWKAPEIQKFSFKKVMVLSVTSDGSARRTFEDAVVASMPMVQGVASYTVLGGSSDMKDVARVEAALKKAGVDAVIVVRLVSDRTEVNSYGTGMGYPMGYRGFGGYYGGYAMGGYDVTTDRIVGLETNIYNYPEGKLVWSGATESVSPGNITQMATDAVSAIRQHLVKQQLVPPLPKK
jgi:hypothetical protein